MVGMSRIETCHVYALKTFDFIVKSICYYFEYFIQLKWQIWFLRIPPLNHKPPKMYCIILTATIYLFYNYFNYLPGENIYEIPENELSFQQSLKLLTDSSQEKILKFYY